MQVNIQVEKQNFEGYEQTGKIKTYNSAYNFHFFFRILVAIDVRKGHCKWLYDKEM